MIEPLAEFLRCQLGSVTVWPPGHAPLPPAAYSDHLREEQRPPEWLLIERPEGHSEPMKYWLSTP